MSAVASNPVEPAGRLRWLWQAENLLVALALAALMVLPLIEIVGRKFFHGGLSGGAALQQHLVLIIGLLGGMFAARDRRLLSLSTLTNFLKGRWQTFARVFSSAFATGITVFLCLAALQLVQSEKGGGKILASCRWGLASSRCACCGTRRTPGAGGSSRCWWPEAWCGSGFIRR
jgi:hypothetical protein